LESRSIREFLEELQPKVNFSLRERYIRCDTERVHGVAFLCLLRRDRRPGRRCGLPLFVAGDADLQRGSFAILPVLRSAITSLSSRLLADEPLSYTSDGAANQNIWNDCQNRCHNDQLPQVNSAMNDKLIDRIQHSGHHKHLPHVLPTLAQQLSSFGWIRSGRPKEGGPTLPGILQPRPDGEDSGYERLDNQPEIHRSRQSTDNVFPQTIQYLMHVGSFRSFSESIL
jgi:hypothetical protein